MCLGSRVPAARSAPSRLWVCLCWVASLLAVGPTSLAGILLDFVVVPWEHRSVVQVNHLASDPSFAGLPLFTS